MGSTPSLAATSPARSRAALLGWLALALLLALNVPLFLCMPLWADVTHYDLCARNLLHGGVAYRDAFDTNLPGMVWLHVAVRATLGWRSETFRAVDLLVVAAAVALLLRYLRRMRVSAAIRAWTAVALFAFYLGTTELTHGQRDVWALVPVLTALHLRLSQTNRLAAATVAARTVLGAALLEGLCWGAAVWIKPFLLVPALACWVVGALGVRRLRAGPGRRLAADAAGLLAGGLLAGAAGCIWLMASGAWPYFGDVMLHWNREYAAFHADPRQRSRFAFAWFEHNLPWSIAPFAALPLAGFLLLHFLRPEVPGGRPTPAAFAPVLLAAAFLGWLLQVLLLQAIHDYVLAPTALLAIALLAGCVRATRNLPVFWLLSAAFAALAGWNHPALKPSRLALWPACWTEGSSARMRDALALQPGWGQVDWQDLEEVARYLESQGVGDGELVCFHDCTQPLYLRLGVRPGTRFFQFNVALRAFPSHREAIRKELESAGRQFIVADLRLAGLTAEEAKAGGPTELPPGVHPSLRATYPFSEPVVFRAGKYAVHRRAGPVRKLWPEGL